MEILMDDKSIWLENTIRFNLNETWLTMSWTRSCLLEIITQEDVMKKELPSYISDRLSADGLSSSRGLLQLMDRLGVVTQRQAAKELGLSPGTSNVHFQKLEQSVLVDLWELG